MLGLVACDDGAVITPLEPEIGGSSFAKAELPLFEPPEGCPAASCLFGPVTLDRETKSPTVLTETFTGAEGQEATLVVLSSNPKTTTVKAWLNGAVVLLPSAMPQSGSNEVRVPITLLEENELIVRLSAKPGTQVVVWVETDVVTPVDPAELPLAAFQLTSDPFALTDDLGVACAGLGEGFTVADWTDVVQAVGQGAAKGDILEAGFALVLNDGTGITNTGFPFFQDRHYAVSTFGADTWTEASVGTEMYWLTSVTNSQPVLCVHQAS
jgi:hypothetical protein